MAKTIDRVSQLDELKPKASEIGNIVMGAALKSGCTPEALQRVVERGGELIAAVLPIIKRLGALVPLVDSKLLAPVDMITLGTAKVSPKDVKDRETPGIEIGWISENAKRLLASMGDRRIEAPEVQLRIHTLRKRSQDPPIIAELGGIEQARVSLAHMTTMMVAQGHGEAGPLLIDGNANIFYLEELPDWAFYCDWDSGHRYWLFHAYPVTNQDGWLDGRQVISS